MGDHFRRKCSATGRDTRCDKGLAGCGSYPGSLAQREVGWGRSLPLVVGASDRATNRSLGSLAGLPRMCFSPRLMGDAYTPGLTVTRNAVVRKSRRLPLAGQVKVALGDHVSAADVVARTDLPGRVHLHNVANLIGVLPEELARKLTVAVGASVAAKQVVAANRAFFGLVNSKFESPITGVLESASALTGVVVFREPPIPVEVRAYVDGNVVEVIDGEGVVIETRGALVQGIFGLAGERQGPIVAGVKKPNQQLDAKDFTDEHRGKVVIGGGQLTLAGFRRAIELGVTAVVCGGFAYQDIKEILGYDVGVAVTGSEDLATTLVVTEGFGNIAMATATFDLLTSLAGETASVNGATQIRAGVIRPEVLVPRLGKVAMVEPQDAPPAGLDVGAPVRGIRAPYFGRIGKIVRLPVELAIMASETKVRVVEVNFNGEKVIVPRANVEVIER